MNPCEKERSEMMSYREYQSLTYGRLITLHNFCNCLQTQEEQAVRSKENMEGGVNQVADQPRILVILPSTLCPLLINFWNASL